MAGAIPLIRPLRESLAGERIVRVMGIVNGTTNFILTAMVEDGTSYRAQALAEAQRLGFAERDPTADVEGHDAAAKAAILAGAGLPLRRGRRTTCYREGITGVDPVDIAFAGGLGYVVKLLAVGPSWSSPDGARISVRVHPAMLPGDSSAGLGPRTPSTPCSSRASRRASSCSTAGAPEAIRRPPPSSATSSTPPTTSSGHRGAVAPDRACGRVRPTRRSALRLVPQHRRRRPPRRAGRGGGRVR